MDWQQSEFCWVKLGGQECIFTTLLSQQNFMIKYLGRKYNFELGTLIKDESCLQLFFRKDNISAAICICITLVGLLVIIIKKLVSRRIVQRIPISNILPQPTNDQEQSFEMATLHSTPRIIRVGHNNRNDTGDLLLRC